MSEVNEGYTVTISTGRESYERRLEQLSKEATSAFSHLFSLNYDPEAPRKYENGYYFVKYGAPTKRMRSILGADREIIILVNTYEEQQPRSVQFARNIIDESDGRLENNIAIVLHADQRGNGKLKRWGREKGIAVIPVYCPNQILPRGPELERLLSFELFSQDPFDITGPVAHDNQFFGRRDEAVDLARKLQKGQIKSSFGMRKIGKTSIMHRVLGEVGSNYDSAVVFVDCQRDDVFGLSAAQLMRSIADSLQSLNETGRSYAELEANLSAIDSMEAAKIFTATLQQFDRPVILAFDEIDYVTPGNVSAPHWKQDFLPFWRNVRAAYHASQRLDKSFSIFLSGVSTRWFTVESIDGVENAALAFVPEEYLSPLPLGAAAAMIKRLGAMSGLRFSEDAAEYIAKYCCNMPFWIRKACSFIHFRIETQRRPLPVERVHIEQMVRDFGSEEGAALSHVALQHLFRVFPELKGPALSLLGGEVEISDRWKRVLIKYGIIDGKGRITGEMMEFALRLEQSSGEFSDTGVLAASDQFLNEWAEELATINARRNTLEKSLRGIVVNFLRQEALSTKGSSKQLILGAIASDRRKALENYSVDVIAERLYWLELSSLVTKNWTLFEKIFGDRTRFSQAADIINDRPDAHAKEIDGATIALQKRELQWVEDRLARL